MDVDKKGIPDGVSPTGGEGSGQHDAEAEIFKLGVGNNLAETILHELLFEQFNLAIRGRFRTDITPGDLIKIVLPSQFAGSETDALFGMVETVSFSMDTNENGGSAYTKVTISHLRTPRDHDSELTVSRHPLYAERWEGAALLGD